MYTDKTDGSLSVLKFAGEAIPFVSEVSLPNNQRSPSLGFSHCNQVSFAWKSYKEEICRQLHV